MYSPTAQSCLVRQRTSLHLVGRRLRHRILPDDRDRRLLAAPDARRRNDAHVARRARASAPPSARVPPRARTRANRKYAHGERRWRRIAFLHDVEVMVERRDLVDLGRARAASRARAPRGARRRDGRSGPGSCAGARSADRGARRDRVVRAAPVLRRAPAGSTARPLGWPRAARCPRFTLPPSTPIRAPRCAFSSGLLISLQHRLHQLAHLGGIAASP